ncbi:MAG: NAD(P)-binding protein, partial [Thermodesulfovibrionales bacterium]|nr:NAD(P)-binding protein [Thermodesulfovibrionales bacterium]
MKYSYWNHRLTKDPEALEYEGRTVSAVLGWGGVKIFDDSADLLALCAEYARAMQHYSCGQCIPCRSGSAVIKELFEGLMDGSGSEGDLDAIASLSSTISKTSMCQIGQSSPAVFTHIIENFRDRLVSSIGKGGKGKGKTQGDKGFRSILTAPCMQACPIHLDIPAYVEAIAKGRFEEALDIIRQKLPLPGVLGRICVRPCEFNCRRGVLDEPIQIKHLKRFVADYEITRGNSPVMDTLDTEDLKDAKKVAIVGAGPAGLTAAHFLVRKGYDVTVFEMLSEPGGMAAVGIPDYRLPREFITREVGYLEQMGVKFIYNRALGANFVLEDLEKEGFKAVFVGMGCHCHKSMGVEGEDKGYKGFVPGVYFLRNVNLGLMDEVPTGKKMVVVGGG